MDLRASVDFSLSRLLVKATNGTLFWSRSKEPRPLHDIPLTLLLFGDVISVVHLTRLFPIRNVHTNRELAAIDLLQRNGLVRQMLDELNFRYNEIPSDQM